MTLTLGTVKPRSVPGPSELAAAFPEFAALEQGSRRAAAIALGDLPAPCAPCMTPEPRRLSECALSPPPGCENLGALVRRVVRAARTEQNPERLRSLAAYDDVWLPGLAAQPPALPVPVELWLDPASPVIGDAARTASALSEGPTPVILRTRVLSRPDRPARQTALGRLAMVAAEQGALIPLAACLGEARAAGGEARAWATAERSAAEAAEALRAIPACAALDLAGLEAAGRAEAVGEALAREQALAAERGVRSGPTWFVNGYRLRGAQSTAALSAALAREGADARAEAGP